MANINQGDTANKTMRVTDGGIEYYDVAWSSALNFTAAAASPIDVKAQLIGRLGNTLGTGNPLVAKPLGFHGWFAATAGGAPVTGALTVVAGLLLKAITANNFVLYSFDSTGLFSITSSLSAQTAFYNIWLPDGRIVSSPAIIWT